MIIPSFSHHTLSLIGPSGHPEGIGAKASATAAKEAARVAERINSVVKLACRVESVLVPPTDGLVASRAQNSKLATAAWATIRNTTCLRWILLTTSTETIAAALPADWLGKGYRNVCFGVIVNDPGSFGDIVRHLGAVPCHCRMALFTSVPRPDEICDHLSGIQWLVVIVDDGDEASADNLRSICQSAGTSSLFIRRDGTLPEPPDATGHAPWSEHPFGPELQLRRPTHPDLRHGDPMPLILNDGPPWLVPKEEAASDRDADPTGLIREPEAMEHTAVACDKPPATATNTQQQSATDLPTLPETDFISDADRSDFVRLDTAARRGVAAFVECGLALAEIQDRKLWRAGDHPTWEGYLRSVLGMSKPHAHRLVQAARFATEITESLPVGNASLTALRPASESQVRSLCRLKSQEQRTTAWRLAVKRADGQPTAKQISEVVAELMAEDPPPAAPRTTLKQQLAETIRELREANAARETAERIESLLHDLEKLLKLT